MATANLPVTSREYKVMLNTQRFRDRNAGAQEFSELLQFLIEKEGGEIVELQTKEDRRSTSYLDTPQLALRQENFSLRLRAETARFQLNLKYRDADRYISAGADVSSSVAGKIKFEEDILPPFVSKFSHSNSIETTTAPQLATMHDVTSMFPGLSGLEIDANTLVTTINDFTAMEVVRKLCKFQFAGTEVLKASLSFWYLVSETHSPIVAEFSFDYDAARIVEGQLESYSSSVVHGAAAVFHNILNQPGWPDLSGSTKTAFALEAM